MLTDQQIEILIGAIGFVILVLWIVYHLMKMEAPDKPEHEFDSARRKMMKGD